MSELGAQNNSSEERTPPNPLANAYSYRPLDSDPATVLIRVLELLPARRYSGIDCGIECKLTHVSLSSDPTYEALSYTWGSPTNPREIAIDGVEFPVTENLFQALTHLRSRRCSRKIWIDAICINQGDISERNEQVKLMGIIYAKAQKVVVWLGEEADFSSEGVSLAQELCDKRQNRDELVKILQQSGVAHRFQALWYLLYRDYWNRIWVVQETFFAQEAVVQCGHASIAWENLIHAQKVFADADFTNYEEIETLRDVDSIFTLAWGGPVSLAPRDPDDENNTISLESVLYWHKSKDASDPRDKVYGILNLVEKSEAALIEVDYRKTVKEVYTAAVKAIIQTTHSLDIISFYSTRDVNLHNLPSWVPDLSSSSGAPWSLQAGSIFKPAAGGPLSAKFSCFDANDNVLNVQGFCIDTISNLAEPCYQPQLGTHDVESGLKAFSAWRKLHVSVKGTSVAQAEAFCMTILWNSFVQEEFEDTDTTLQDVVKSRLRALIRRSASYGICKADQRMLESIEEHPDVTKHNDELVDSFTEIFDERRFVVGKRGVMALVPGEADKGDMICIILGHRLPLVLRKVKNKAKTQAFVLIGEASVDGYMTGQGVAELHEGKWKAKGFSLY
ncbi:HET-domain-containing protein [Stipitochalara longipes BDJ]|nr:HET-domain-containing protein [Stipitochalara longipes BDJ]